MVKDYDFCILCGGLGTRLRTVTGDAPKVMAEINGEPFLDFVIRYLMQEGARRIILCAGYKAEELVDHYKKKFSEIEIEFSIEKERLGTGGAFKNAESLIQSEYFFGLNGDCFTPVDYKALVDFKDRHKAKGALILTKVDNPKDFGTILTDAEDSILEFREKEDSPTSAYINAGVYLFKRDVLDQMPSGAFSIEYDFFPKMVDHAFYGMKVDKPFIDIGTPERFAWAQQYLKDMV